MKPEQIEAQAKLVFEIIKDKKLESLKEFLKELKEKQNGKN